MSGRGESIMMVYELIEYLQDCPPTALVMYDATIGMEQAEEPEEKHFGVDDVLIGSGTLKGFVYLSEEKLTD